MAFNLTIFPLRQGLVEFEFQERGVTLAFDRLDFVGDDGNKIASQLIKLNENEPTIKGLLTIPSKLQVGIHTDNGLEYTRSDRDGNELKFVYAKELKKLVMPEDTYFFNLAIKAFIDALPDDVPIILYWH